MGKSQFPASEAPRWERPAEAGVGVGSHRETLGECVARAGQALLPKCASLLSTFGGWIQHLSIRPCPSLSRKPAWPQSCLSEVPFLAVGPRPVTYLLCA